MVCKMLNIRYPIIQAGMAGGPTTPKLVAAVSETGALGTLGAGYMTPLQIRDTIHAIQQLTKAPFGVNLFLPERYEVDEKSILNMQKQLNTYRMKLGISEVNTVPDRLDIFEQQLEVVMQSGVKIVSFTFDAPSTSLVEKLHASGIVVIATATTVKEAVELESNGVDVIVAQGSEAGGHRGTFLDSENETMIGTMALVPQVVDAVSCSVIASGGIMDGRGYAASLALGASGVQLGTAFLTVHESGASTIHQQAILSSKDTDTKLTKAFSGKNARGLKNDMMLELEMIDKLPPYPVQHVLTSDIRKEAANQQNKEMVSMWAGQAASLSKKHSAKELIESLENSKKKIISELFSSHDTEST
ncbi:nitronate monooxygenase [Fictibacillus nanhaiensis]|uniref:NAD(P)H-dependent flavin oxidoreductase n=1 Tax=Fictibacillus nanhaiensis TaxID=742169 RepID=UPI001C95BCB2|nr:nitronate monooxygenase [Fictibacillus nanhaiensis]MBY6037628.1 nitronate monooxygenase [Fictibacillus nanhaiensis]